MVNFQFTKGDPVEVKETGEVGTVLYCDTDPTTNAPFYQVRFEDGKTGPVAESQLRSAR